MNLATITACTLPIVEAIAQMPLAERVEALNIVRELLHSVSPFKTEPVDFVKWVPNGLVHQNDYNPNSVAPPEMELLRLSIEADGYTQPIVSTNDHEVIDGFHRHRVGKECADIQARVHGYLPLVQIRESQTCFPVKSCRSPGTLTTWMRLRPSNEAHLSHLGQVGVLPGRLLRQQASDA